MGRKSIPFSTTLFNSLFISEVHVSYVSKIYISKTRLRDIVMIRYWYNTPISQNSVSTKQVTVISAILSKLQTKIALM